MDYDIGEAFQRIEEELIASMSRNLSRHLKKEEAEGISYTMWQAEQLAALNRFRKDNREKFAIDFSTINDKIEEVLKKANESGKMDQEAQILRAIKKGWRVARHDDGMQGAFFRINDRKLNALIKATTHDMAKAEHAALRMTNDVYRKTVFNSGVYYNSGAGTLEQCVDMATKDFLSRGINCVEYANGARVGIDTYARMALRTAQTRSYIQGESAKRDEWGVNTVIVNKRGAACPRCMQWVGRVFYDDVFGSLPVTDDKYPPLSTAIEGGLFHPNCKDICTTFFPGINTEPEPPTEKQTAEANRVYALEQRQQYNDRMIRKYKRLSAGSIDPQNQAKYTKKAKEWESIQRDFVNQNSDVLHDSANRRYKEKSPELAEDLTTSGKSDTIQSQHFRSFENGNEVNRFFGGEGGLLERKKSAEQKWLKSLSTDESRAVSYYCADGYYDVNAYFRQVAGSEHIDADTMKGFAKDLDSAINKFNLSENITVYRGIDNNALEDLDLNNLIGSIYEDKGYMSTSPIRPDIVERRDALLEIQVPAGQGRGAYVNSLSGFKDDEYEFLLKRGTKCKITSVDLTGEKPIIRMKVIGE